MKQQRPTTHAPRRKRRAPDVVAVHGDMHEAAPTTAQGVELLRDEAAPQAQRAAVAVALQGAVGNAAVARELAQSSSAVLFGTGFIARCPEVPPKPMMIVGSRDEMPADIERVPLPTVPPRLGGDADVITFVQGLAACRAEYEAQQAHDREVATARRRRQPPPEFDPARVETFTQQYIEEFTADFESSQVAAIARMGAAWQTRARNTLRREKRRLERLARPRRGQTTPPLSQEEVAAQLREAYTLQLCEMSQHLADVQHAWMVGRREQMRFRTTPQRARRLGRDFAPSREVADSERVPIPAQISSGGPGVAPEVAAFLEALGQQEPGVRAGNYGGHGGGPFHGRGFSVDLTFTGTDAPQDDRGFYQQATAVRLLLAINKIVSAVHGQWRAIYNDFAVAQQVNEATGVQNVIFVGELDRGGKLNWHGPGPLVLHFHLDLQLPPPAPAGGQPAANQGQTSEQ